MAGVYIHIPFCRKACHYCNFHFSTTFGKKDDLIRAIISEIDLQKGYLSDPILSTIYFGGGTPSAIPASDIAHILEALYKNYSLSPGTEITLEANPDDITTALLKEWKQTGVNRLSIGIQAFQDEMLVAWNRSHLAEQAKEAIYRAQDMGFENINADLIYGGPGLSDKEWIQNIQTITDNHIPHLSCYALTVEPRTALAYQIEKGKVRVPDEDQANRQYDILQRMMLESGFDQYEVSNFSKPGMASRHNTSYWSGAPYLGLGPSAHSYNGNSRQWNVANNIRYISTIESGIIPFEKELLSQEEQFNELVMTGLRTSYGIDHKRMNMLGESFIIYLEEGLSRHSEQIFRNPSGNWRLRPEFFFFADGIAADLFIPASSTS